uniref:Tr-type G domain-containing protein n=1 Tax=Glossina pallidipes TaxID=7398 RepID=A0A1A9ZGB5_GLOPL
MHSLCVDKIPGIVPKRLISKHGGEHGLDEDEYQTSVATMQSLTTTLNADMVLLKQRKVKKKTVAVVGNVDAGKSTLLGVFTHGELDNGRGHDRQRRFRHKHEMQTGRTSCVGNDILGFDSIGNVVNRPDHEKLLLLSIWLAMSDT